MKVKFMPLLALALAAAACLWTAPAPACSMDMATDADHTGLNGDKHATGPLLSVVTLYGCDVGSGGAGCLGGGSCYFSQILIAPVAGGRVFIVADSNLRGTVTPDPVASVSAPAKIMTWGAMTVRFRLDKLWEDLNGNYICDGEPGAGENALVAPSELPPGDYTIRLRTVYWSDTNANGVLDQPNPANPNDPANEITLVATSDPSYLTITNEPYLQVAKPKQAAPGSVVTLLGTNLGDTQADSTINIYKRDGQTLVATLTAGSHSVRHWENQRIRFRMAGSAGQVRMISVTVAGQESTKVKVKLAK